MRLYWRFGVVAAFFLAIFTLYPQMKLVYLRGSEWNGHYAFNDIDEVAYGSYLRALIDGRSRKNDPYSGNDDKPGEPQPESLFSIQFAAPMSIAVPARVFGIGAPWAMTFSGLIAGILAAFAVFWLIGRLTGNSWYAMAASLSVFAFGTLAAGEGAVGEILFDGFSYPYFPGFRRYIPALAIPAFFGACGAVWMMLASDKVEQRRRRLIYGAAATFCFAFTVYSYFYIWTTAAAFLAAVAAVWLVERPEGFQRDMRSLGILALGWIAVLLPYAYLLSNRSHTMDDVQLLVHTRMPDLFRVPEYISFAVLLIIIAGLALKKIEIKDRRTLFSLALALVPLIVFNQQMLTGRSLQPIHYQVFIGNYAAMLALMFTLGTIFNAKLAQNRTGWKFACAALTLAAAAWGIVECHYTVRVLDEANIERDKALPLARRLEELAATDGDPHGTTVHSYDMLLADDLPTVAPQNVLWARHQHVFAGLTWEENKRRYYQYLYFSGVDERGLDYLLKNDFVSMIALFGWGRHTDRLSSDARPLTFGEIAEEARRYGEYIAAFNSQKAAEPLLSYVIVDNRQATDLSNLDRWYVRDGGEVFGDHTLYRVRLK